MSDLLLQHVNNAAKQVLMMAVQNQNAELVEVMLLYAEHRGWDQVKTAIY